MPSLIPIVVLGYRCERCGHQWKPRNSDEPPLVCPWCKTHCWDQPKRGSVAQTPAPLGEARMTTAERGSS
jgi:hypothetical protein